MHATTQVMKHLLIASQPNDPSERRKCIFGRSLLFFPSEDEFLFPANLMELIRQLQVKCHAFYDA